MVTAFDCGQKRAKEDVAVHIDVKPVCKPGWQGQTSIPSRERSHLTENSRGKVTGVYFWAVELTIPLLLHLSALTASLESQLRQEWKQETEREGGEAVRTRPRTRLNEQKLKWKIEKCGYCQFQVILMYYILKYSSLLGKNYTVLNEWIHTCTQ